MKYSCLPSLQFSYVFVTAVLSSSSSWALCTQMQLSCQKRNQKEKEKNRLIAFDFPGSFFSLTYAFWRWDQFRVRANVTLRTTCRSRHKYRNGRPEILYISAKRFFYNQTLCTCLSNVNEYFTCLWFFFRSFFFSLSLLHIGRKCEKYDVDFFIWNRKQTINIAHYIYEQTFVFTEKKNTNRQENKLLAYLYG